MFIRDDMQGTSEETQQAVPCPAVGKLFNACRSHRFMGWRNDLGLQGASCCMQAVLEGAMREAAAAANRADMLASVSGSPMPMQYGSPSASTGTPGEATYASFETGNW